MALMRSECMNFRSDGEGGCGVAYGRVFPKIMFKEDDVVDPYVWTG